MALLKRQASQELLPTRAPKLARGQDASALSRLGARIITNTVKLLSSNASAFYEAAIEDVIPKPSHPPKQPRTPRKLARPAIPKQFRVEPQPSFGQSPPPSCTPSPTRKPLTTRSSPPALPPPQTQTHASRVFPSTLSQQGSQETVTSIETLLVSAQRRRRNGLKNHRTNGLPAYYQSRDHIHAKRHKVMVQKTRKLDLEEMIKTLYEDRRTKGYKSGLDDFKSLLIYEQRLEQKKIIPGSLSPSASTSDLHSKSGATSREQRRHSTTELRETELDGDFLRRLIQRAKKSLDGPPPKRPFVPSLEQLCLSRKAEGDEIERSLRRKGPLPSRLPLDDEAYVDAILTKRGIVSKTGREQVAENDIARLRPCQWLNDEIINFYGQLILSRSEDQQRNLKSTPTDGRGRINGNINGLKGKAKAETTQKSYLNVHYFNTFFWPTLKDHGYQKGRLAKWTKKFDLFSKDVILIPINRNNSHWTAAAINFRKKRIHSYDSMGTAGSQFVTQALRKYLDEEHREKKKKPFDFTGWVDWVDEETPQQENGYDCGVFACQFLQALSRGEEDDFGFTQVDMPYLRRRMIWEIANAKLRDDT